ncbi:MAG: hypothetical protein ACYTAS_16225 [Planctomycetota bacterium]
MSFVDPAAFEQAYVLLNKLLCPIELRLRQILSGIGTVPLWSRRSQDRDQKNELRDYRRGHHRNNEYAASGQARSPSGSFGIFFIGVLLRTPRGGGVGLHGRRLDVLR